MRIRPTGVRGWRRCKFIKKGAEKKKESARPLARSVLHGFCTSIDSRFLDNWANASVAFRNTNDYMDSVYKTQDTFDDTSANAIAALHSPLSALRRTTSMSTPAAVHGRGKVATRFTTPLELFFLQTASNHRMRNCIFTTLTTRSIIAKGETLIEPSSTNTRQHSTMSISMQRFLSRLSQRRP